MFKIRQSPQLREKYAKQFSDSRRSRELVAPVKTRWRSDFDAISHVLADREPLEKLLASERTNLRAWKLTDEEWVYLEKVKRLLEVCLHSCIFGKNVGWSNGFSIPASRVCP